VRPASAEASSLRKPTIQERFDAWMAANPEVYDEIVRLARQAKEAGRTRCGMKELWEVARWHLRLRTRGDDFRLNNDFCAPAVRLIQEREPDLAHMFETRRRRSP
jgi:hypothetical protein